MGSVVAFYDALTNAADDHTRARVIAEAFERLEARYPHLPDLATQQHLRESELRLQKEIAQVGAELKETELRLQKEIAEVGAELKETELRLQKEIVQVRADLTLQIEQLRGEVKTEIEQLRGEVKTEIEQLRGEIKEVELRLQKEIEQVRGEVKGVELRLQKEIEQVRADLTLQIERSRVSLLLWLIPLMFAQVGAIAALVKLL